MEAISDIKITRRKLQALGHDAVKTAAAVDLVYVSDSEEGIARIKNGEKFIYKFNGKTVTDKDHLERIKSLVIPPAWQHVWICINPNGHLQVTGMDVKNRKQYKYHSLWNALRNHTKYFHLHDFGMALPDIRKQLQKDLAQQGLTLTKVLAAVVSLMQCTCIRIGNSIYEKMNGSFGLTTLKDRHVKINGQKMKFSFKGKKGVYHDITLKSKKLAKIVQACRDIPGKELFQYYDEDRKRHAIDSGMVNGYIKSISGGDFTAKDFRTWAGTLKALHALKDLGLSETETEAKKKIVQALDTVAEHLGNTRTVCKKYYVHPVVIDLYSNKKLHEHFRKLDEEECKAGSTALTQEERIMMEILNTNGTVTI